MTTPPTPPPPPPPGPPAAQPGPAYPAGQPQAAQPYGYPAGQQYGSPPGPYAGAPLAPKPPALPQDAVEYQHLLRGARRAWWRPLVSLLLVLVGVVGASVGLLFFVVVGWLVTGEDLGAFEELSLDFNNPVSFAAQNLWLALLIPIAGIATWVAHSVRPGFVSSVVGRFRWGWFAWCLLVVVPLWVGYILLATLVLDDSGLTWDTAGRPSTWVALLVLTFLTTPLQAAGEEYLFRGWLMQQVGAYVRNTYAALAIAIVISAVVFALGHTSLDPWILIDLGAFATAAVLLTWRTGGLEAAVALHIVNNVIVLCLSILTVGLGDAFITPETTGSPLGTVMSLVAYVVVTAAIWWLAGRRGVARRSVPAPATPPGAAALVTPSEATGGR